MPGRRPAPRGTADDGLLEPSLVSLHKFAANLDVREEQAPLQLPAAPDGSPTQPQPDQLVEIAGAGADAP